MLFVVFGSSAAGKTTVLNELRGTVERLAVHDFDEIGVPADADTVWRHRANEVWVKRALELQADGIDLLLAGQSPLGELLASPSAGRLDGIEGLLLDVDDATRVSRLAARGDEWVGRSERYLSWAAWMRAHAADRSHMEHVVRIAETERELVWDRPHDWQIEVLDTTHLSVEDVRDRLVEWVSRSRLRRSAPSA
jgi:hypothetical protein